MTLACSVLPLGCVQARLASTLLPCLSSARDTLAGYPSRVTRTPRSVLPAAGLRAAVSQGPKNRTTSQTSEITAPNTAPLLQRAPLHRGPTALRAALPNTNTPTPRRPSTASLHVPLFEERDRRFFLFFSFDSFDSFLLAARFFCVALHRATPRLLRWLRCVALICVACQYVSPLFARPR